MVIIMAITSQVIMRVRRGGSCKTLMTLLDTEKTFKGMASVNLYFSSSFLSLLSLLLSILHHSRRYCCRDGPIVGEAEKGEFRGYGLALGVCA